MGVERAAALICAWLATYFIHSTLLLGVTWVSTRRLPSRFDSLSELIWRGALVLPIVTALTQSVFPSIRLLEPANVGGIEYSPQPLAIMHVPSWVWIGGATLWLLGALAGLGQLIACHRRLRRQIADRTTLPGEVWRVISPLIARDDVRVSVVHDLAIPFALMREICLPSWLPDRMSHAELRAVVAHELSHVRRRDAFWRIATAAVRRAFFFQPLNWVAVTRLRELSECICDDEAIAAISSPVPLASALERVASRAITDRARLTLAPAMGGGGGAPVSFTVKR
ncbi:MAG TPA: M56 family metallopeptidase, partial [Gemmatimonadaceae bacterium]|nr:M56 family metallopeptidase [Gemmatimonadaceae bacterium]